MRARCHSRTSTGCAVSFTVSQSRPSTKTRNEFMNPTSPHNKAERVKNFLSLERNVTAASGAVFLLGLGEELWKKFLPKYLQALGASVPVIGLFGTAEDFLDAIYQYPGGWIADRFGRRQAFLIFLALACLGYLAY